MSANPLTLRPEATWENGVPVYMVGRPGYGLGEEWMAKRLPWFRRLDTTG